MARQVSKDIINAFINNQKRNISNSSTDGQSLFLHGHKIAWKEEGKYFINMCGWGSPTTRERLNTLLRTINASFGVGQRNYSQCLIGNDCKIIRHINTDETVEVF